MDRPRLLSAPNLGREAHKARPNRKGVAPIKPAANEPFAPRPDVVSLPPIDHGQEAARADIALASSSWIAITTAEEAHHDKILMEGGARGPTLRRSGRALRRRQIGSLRCPDGGGRRARQKIPHAGNRTMSSELRLGHCSFMDEPWSIVDCPGSVEFAYEASAALAAVDFAVVVCEPSPDRLSNLPVLLKSHRRAWPAASDFHQQDRHSRRSGARTVDALRPYSKFPWSCARCRSARRTR